MDGLVQDLRYGIRAPLQTRGPLVLAVLCLGLGLGTNAALFDVTGGDRPEHLTGASVSGELFSVLRVRPVLGRTFAAEEERAGGPRVTILGQGLWQRRFGGDRSIVGTELTLNGERVTAVGVMPPGFAFPTGAELWASAAIDHELEARGARGAARERGREAQARRGTRKRTRRAGIDRAAPG